MLLTPRAKLSDRIVRLLAEHPASPVTAIHARLSDCSRRGLYKELRQLQTDGVVIGSGKRYSLRLGWVMELEQLVERAHRRNIESLRSVLPLGQSEARMEWRFPDLRRVDDYWIQVALALFDHTHAPQMHYWIRHSWFALAHPEKDDQFQRLLRRGGRRLMMIIGARSFLDRFPSPSWPRDVYRFSFEPSPFDRLPFGSLTVVDDYVVTLRLDRRLTAALERLYTQVQHERDLTLDAHRSLFEARGECRLVLERAPLKAASFRRRFDRFFQGQSA